MTDTHPHVPTALGHLGPAGDHNTHPVDAVPALLDAVAAATGRRADLFGSPFAVVRQPSAHHLAGARGTLTTYADAADRQLGTGRGLVCVNGRCAASLATVPRVVRQHPEAVVLWLDAHADLNLPGGGAGESDYLGGMAVSGLLGWWDTGLGAGLAPERLVLVGTRSIDPPEQEVIERHGIAVLDPASTDGSSVVAALAGRPVFVHLDCDVLEPGTFATDYCEPGGLSLDQLEDLARAVASTSEVVGVEIAEWEGPGTHGAADLVRALAPLLDPLSAR